MHDHPFLNLKDAGSPGGPPANVASDFDASPAGCLETGLWVGVWMAIAGIVVAVVALAGGWS